MFLIVLWEYYGKSYVRLNFGDTNYDVRCIPLQGAPVVDAEGIEQLFSALLLNLIIFSILNLPVPITRYFLFVNTNIGLNVSER